MTSDDRAQMLLDERATALARRHVAATAKTERYLICMSGSEQLGLKLADVGSVLAGRSYTSLPKAPTGLLGIVALSGQIVTVVDLGIALGLPSSPTKLETGHLVRLRQQKPAVAFAVERALGIAEVDPTLLRNLGSVGDNAASLGGAGISRYAPPGCDNGLEFSESFVIVDLSHVLKRLVSSPGLNSPRRLASRGAFDR